MMHSQRTAKEATQQRVWHLVVLLSGTLSRLASGILIPRSTRHKQAAFQRGNRILMETAQQSGEGRASVAPEIAISAISSLILGAIAFIMWAYWDLLAPIAQ